MRERHDRRGQGRWRDASRIVVNQLSRGAALSLVAAITTPRAGVTQAARRDSVHAILVGRHESADVYLDVPAADTVRQHWTPPSTPGPLTPAGPVHLRILVPITLGAAAVPPGRYAMWVAGTGREADLVLTQAPDSGDDAYAESRERVRAPLGVTYDTNTMRATAVTVRTTRRGADTIVVVDHSTPRMTIRESRILPASSSVLQITIGDVVLSVPIGAP